MRLERTETFRVPPAQLWPLMANTESLNREVGLPPVDYEYVPLPRGGSVMLGRARSAGITLEWEEHPYEWIWPRAFSVRRLFSKGPFKEFSASWKLEPEGSSETRMSVALAMEPSGLPGKLMAGALLKRGVGQIFDAARGFEKFLVREAETPYPNRFRRADVNIEALESSLARMKGLPVKPALLDRLALLIGQEVDERVRDLRPFPLADAWGEDRFDVLRLCLYAARAGLLDLRWHVICPRCRGSKASHDTLKKLSTQHACDACAIKFPVDLERRIEARFMPHSAIRQVNGALYCVAGPMNSPHIYAQFRLAPGERRTETMTIPPGRYAVRRADREETGTLTVGAGPDETLLELGDRSPAVELAAGGRLTLKNSAADPLRISIEQPYLEGSAATAAAVTSLQEFRDLYATDALSPGVELTIGALSILFSDLKGSTQLYERIGDAPAYGVVRRHFEFMTGRVRAARGAVVKTMGDAVMAVFREPLDAVRCALTIQKEAPDGSIKIGIHHGSCLAVTSVDYLDYFGSTVNIAQRAQGQSAGGDIVLTDSVFRDPRVQEAVAAAGAHESPFTAALKGLEGRHTLHRVVLRGRE